MASVDEPNPAPPPEPAQSPASWTLAAAARREVGAALATPTVIAIDQTLPLGFLQHLPVLGPIFIMPIVTVVHQVPFLGDILHRSSAIRCRTDFRPEHRFRTTST